MAIPTTWRCGDKLWHADLLKGGDHRIHAHGFIRGRFRIMRKPVGGVAPASEASCAFCSTSHHAGGGVDSTHTQRTCVVLAPNVRPFRPNGELSAGFRITLAEIFLRRFSRVTGGCPSPHIPVGGIGLVAQQRFAYVGASNPGRVWYVGKWALMVET